MSGKACCRGYYDCCAALRRHLHMIHLRGSPRHFDHARVAGLAAVAEPDED